MGIYSKKFLESAVEDTIQTPDDIGNDLDQIEKNIAGPDGIEGHREEIEDAETGVVGDPLEESYMAMYESEYNYNQLMKAIGTVELREMSNGRDIVIEAVDIKAFFDNIKKIVKKLFEAITKAVVKVIDELTLHYESDAKWIRENKQNILAGADKGLEVTGFDFPDAINILRYVSPLKTYNIRYDKDIDSAKNGNGVKLKKIEDAKKDYLTAITGDSSIDNIEDMKSYITNKLFGSKDVVKFPADREVAEDAIDLLSSNRDISRLRNSYKNTKEYYNSIMKKISDLESSASKEKDNNLVMSVINYYSSLFIFGSNIFNMAQSIALKAARTKRSQARRIANKLAELGKANEIKGNNSDKQTSTNESVYSRISRIKFM